MIGSAEMCGQVDRAREPWTVSSIALRAGEALLEAAADPTAQREAVIAERERLREALSRTAGLRVFRSQANFLLLKITRPGISSSRLCERLLQNRILIQNAAGFRGLDSRFVRISIRSAADNDRLLQALQAALEQRG
jgi:threonine-phosphate decarboxylase